MKHTCFVSVQSNPNNRTNTVSKGTSKSRALVDGRIKNARSSHTIYEPATEVVDEVLKFLSLPSSSSDWRLKGRLTSLKDRIQKLEELVKAMKEKTKSASLASKAAVTSLAKRVASCEDELQNSSQPPADVPSSPEWVRGGGCGDSDPDHDYPRRQRVDSEQATYNKVGAHILNL
jgi:polyhydroxyalkanoate synthesis regulator phasin